MELCDLRDVADLSHAHGIGRDRQHVYVAVFSASNRFRRRHGGSFHHQIFNGHSDGLGSVVVGTKPEQADKLAFLQKCAGAILSPFECWLILRGVKTLAVRMEQHDRSGRRIAGYL